MKFSLPVFTFNLLLTFLSFVKGNRLSPCSSSRADYCVGFSIDTVAAFLLKIRHLLEYFKITSVSHLK